MGINNKLGTTILFMAAILLVSIACIPAVSASPNKDATNTVSAIGTPTVKALKDIGILKVYHLNEGGYRVHYTNVVSGKHFFDPTLIWMPSTSSLSLTINKPLGGSFGPYYDGSDGRIDGKIDFDYPPIQSVPGLEQGEWISVVEAQEGSADYSYSVSVT
ncbi:hypothetical protein ASJ81_06945 [Methanosarcina spelaei]|uniref:Uncharacterized protein n=1 Tax=Methanosarcina spelaei TaxID=1036679 RepID=A0A2A2HSQ2_9EURY|nr:hypothetical protein [Methanosarcina spelaei]PAV12320.1 hypothetical protein ASJ81_06945 [Methanosarcina spelaei]